MKLFLGVDGGQSSTTALIGDEHGKVLGIGRGGPCNHVKTGDGRTKFLNAMNESLGIAAKQAGFAVADIQFAVACLGFSGGPADKQGLLQEMLRTERLIVTHDALIALMGATSGEPGVIVIAGTGSIAFGRNSAGKSVRAGGWGYVYGDEGGAFDITRQAVRAALRLEEGWGPSTSLHSRLMEVTDANSANELLHKLYTTDFPRPKVAAMSQVVDQAAGEGDQVAVEILHSAAQALATYAGAVRAQLFEMSERVAVSYVGGVFRSELVRDRFRMLVEFADGVQFGAPKFGPAAGALLEAYRVAGLRPHLQSPEVEK